MVCADLANGSKHCRLTRSSRTGQQPHITGKERNISTWLNGDGGGEVIKCKYTILNSTDFIDALELARESVELWQNFIDRLESFDKLS